jgi:hypothetical protein
MALLRRLSSFKKKVEELRKWRVGKEEEFLVVATE